ncbi:hypothetical protein [Mariniflexile maritimum]|uniref:hypothetical protein n=1 Tax=Mariniflexile maritimum TaxID=2682493 RepID=UPI0012F66DF6|nr:hypothetical protein [Mariniflexile maritimum]
MVKKSKHSPQSILSKVQAKNKKFKGNIFWKTHPTNGRPIIEPSLLREFLIANGFSILNFFGGTFTIKTTFNIVVFYSPQDVFNFCLTYVNSQKKEVLTSEFLVNGERFLISKKALIGSLPELEIEKYRDTKSISHYFYENIVVRVNPKGIYAIPYKEFKKQKRYIFKSAIINRHFDGSCKLKSQFKKFLKLTTNSKEHYLNVIIVIGYLLHKYKNPSIAKAVIISDVLSQATNDPHGRSGKGIIIKALSELINVIEYNGKNLDLKRDKFVYQSIEPDTDLFVIQDVGREFEFEDLFSTITDSLNIERKHQKKIIVDNADSPKIAMTTNYTIPQNSDSYSDRKQLLLLNNYFNSSNKPQQEFKKLLFTEWDENDYKAFDKFMMSCLQMYLKLGLTNYDDPALRKQNLINNTSKKFVELMEKEYTSSREYYNLKDLANKLDISSNDNSVRSKITSQWLQTYAAFKGHKYETRISGGVTKFSLIKKP